MICVSVGEKNWKDAADAAAGYPFTEIRLDYFDSVNTEIVANIFSSGRGEKIATFRKTESVSDQERIGMIVTALNCGASYADADINNDASFIKSISEAAAKTGAKLIVSYHNFNETPCIGELEKIIEKAAALGGDIIKIACSAETAEEAERLLSIPAGRNNIVIAGMGSMGGRIRVLSPFCRSLFTYASPDTGKAVAPGQIPYSELLEKQKRLGNEW